LERHFNAKARRREDAKIRHELNGGNLRSGLWGEALAHWPAAIDLHHRARAKCAASSSGVSLPAIRRASPAQRVPLVSAGYWDRFLFAAFFRITVSNYKIWREKTSERHFLILVVRSCPAVHKEKMETVQSDEEIRESETSCKSQSPT
jgi:hypothetical protein